MPIGARCFSCCGLGFENMVGTDTVDIAITSIIINW